MQDFQKNIMQIWFEIQRIQLSDLRPQHASNKKNINEKVNQVYVACINHIGNCLLSTTMKHDYSNYLLIE